MTFNAFLFRWSPYCSLMCNVNVVKLFFLIIFSQSELGVALATLATSPGYARAIGVRHQWQMPDSTGQRMAASLALCSSDSTCFHGHPSPRPPLAARRWQSIIRTARSSFCTLQPCYAIDLIAYLNATFDRHDRKRRRSICGQFYASLVLYCCYQL